eukprot:13573133-Alexandrium_andersonii.AAC.1
MWLLASIAASPPGSLDRVLPRLCVATFPSGHCSPEGAWGPNARRQHGAAMGRGAGAVCRERSTSLARGVWRC